MTEPADPACTPAPPPVSIPTLDIDPVGVDLYVYDDNSNPDIASLIAADLPWSFAIFKAAEGTGYDAGTWLKTQWAAARATPRYGSTWLRGAYTYLLASEDGVAQADWFLACVQRAGGWDTGDLWPILDFERGEQPANVTKTQIEQVLGSCAERVHQVTGRSVMRYTGELFRSLGITDKLGCDYLWVASYGNDVTDTLSPATYTEQGYTLADTWGWQFRGTSPQTAGPKGYPMTAPAGPGGSQVPLDLTAIIINGGGDPNAQLPWTVAHL